MSITTYESSPRGKCCSCKHYSNDRKRHSWVSGDCVSAETKVKNKHRDYNDRACVQYVYDKDWLDQYKTS